ncbi:MAG: ankyrin repeat domain-containing protein, partial [Planctomycetaceae bacterium]
VSIWKACCVGDLETVKNLIDADPTIVNQSGGFFDWEPLMYACYSRLQVPGCSTLAVAEFLLDNGANANAYYMWGGQYRFTALTGVFGEGEHGPGNCPEHPECLALARLLLERGADANDSQALYNRMFTPGSSCLELLLEFGLGPDSCSNWLLEEDGNLIPNQKQTLQYQLQHAIGAGFVDRARLCVEGGADLTTPLDGRPFYEQALLAGDKELAEYLVSRGAERCALDRTTAFAAACLTNNEPAAVRMLEEDPTLLADTQTSVPELISRPVDTSKYETVRLLVRLGIDLERNHTPLHSATWGGDLHMVKLLVELGCNPRRQDGSHHATPMQWATYRKNREDFVQFLSACDIDIFDAILSGQPSAIRRVLEADQSSLNVTYGSLRTNVPDAEARADTPLARAVRDGKLEAVQTLLELGANRDFVSPGGQTLVELAQANGSNAIVALLD